MMHPQRARSVHGTPNPHTSAHPTAGVRRAPAGANWGSGIGPESGAPGSGFRSASGLPPRQTLARNPRALRTHQRGRSQGTIRWAPPRHGSRTFRRAASRRMADMDSGPGTRSVRVMAGHRPSQGLGRSAGRNWQRAGTIFRVLDAGRAQVLDVLSGWAAAQWLDAAIHYKG